MLTQSFILMAVGIWILGVPIALGFTLKGKWPTSKKEFGATILESWVAGLFWPLTLSIILVRLMLELGWFLVTLITRGLFRFGGYLRRF